jgi:hypothetical protein
VRLPVPSQGRCWSKTRVRVDVGSLPTRVSGVFRLATLLLLPQLSRGGDDHGRCSAGEGARMRRNRSWTRKVTSLTLAASLLVATSPDVYGLHQCPFHGGHSEDGQTQQGHPPQSTDFHAETLPGTPSQGICAWLVDCYACVESAPSLSAPVSIVGSIAPALPIFPAVRVDGPLGPRHQLFELHLPNAPPLSA